MISFFRKIQIFFMTFFFSSSFARNRVWSILLLFFAVLCFFGCTVHENVNIVSLEGVRDGMVVSKSTAYEFAPDMFLTSAHSVRDSRMRYLIGGVYAQDILRDDLRDRAVLSLSDKSVYFPNLTAPKVGDVVRV